MKYEFPRDFLWGTATASYQVEGAWNADDKGENIWDRFTHQPGHIEDGTNGDVTCDFYHRYAEDIALAKRLGLQVYRMSVSWARVIPAGTGKVSRAGLNFYRRVFEELRRNGIKVALTLYHWDLPQKLQDRGGWANREIVDWFEEYAALLFEEYGDIVDQWITLNEPFCTSMLGYWTGEHAPGYHDYGMAMSAVHNLLLCHGKAVECYRKAGLKAEIGVTLNLHMRYPLDPARKADVDAANRESMMSNRVFADPIFLGRYPEEMMTYLRAQGVALPEVKPGDLALISQPVDFFGLNTYFTEHVTEDLSVWPLHARCVKTGLPRTDADWEIDPNGMYDLLRFINDTYHPGRILITENGAASNDWVGVDGRVEDPNRITYMKLYLAQVHRAIKEGVPVGGYYSWCFCDNFEWAWGMRRRFGMVYVDYATQKRTLKESAKWYAETIRKNGFEM